MTPKAKPRIYGIRVHMKTMQIEDNNGKVYTYQEAIDLLNNSKKPIDYTMSFGRLVQFGGDIEKLKEYYQNNK